jgi:outer membrane protein OmpA-like peptidoglycan-associated protein
MRRMIALFVTLAVVSACWSPPCNAQTPADSLRHSPPGVSVPPHVLIPVRLGSPGGVHIRSFRNSPRFVIVRVPVWQPQPAQPAVVPAPAPSGLTQADLQLLEARLMSYLDRRLEAIEQRQRDLLASLQQAPPGPGATIVWGDQAAPPVETPAVIGDTAKPETLTKQAVPDSVLSARVNEIAVNMERRTPPAVTEPATLPPATPSVSESAPLPPAPTVVEVEHAILETGLLRTVNILFERNRASLLPSSSSILDTLGSVLSRYPDIRLEIAGHTDSVGTDDYNMQLSQRRAETVRKYLLEKFSIAPDRLTAHGYGESRPIADNDTSTGRAMNRRVEFVLLRPEPSPHRQ